MSWWTDLFEQDKDLKSQLNEENKEYYKKMDNYIRFGTQLKDSAETENLLKEILRRFISMQENGLPTEEYFGENSKLYADEKLSTLNNNYNWIVKTIIVFIIGQFLFSFALNDLSINLFKMLLSAINFSIWWIVIFKFSKWDVYSKMNPTIRFLIYMITTICLFMLGSYLSQTVEGATESILLPYIPTTVILLIVLLIITILFFIKQAKKKLDWLIVMIFMWSSWIIGVLNYLQ